VAFSERDPVERIARHQHECWAAHLRDYVDASKLSDRMKSPLYWQRVSFDGLPEVVQDKYRKIAREYVAWVRESLSGV